MKILSTIIEEHKTSNKIKTEDRHKELLYLLEYIKNNNLFTSVEVKTNIRLVYLSDFYGLLTYISSNSMFHYLNMLLNNLSSSNEYDGSKSTILLVDETNEKITYIKEKIKSL